MSNEKHTSGRLKFRSGPLRREVHTTPILWIEDEDGQAVVHWMGFDSGRLSNTRKRANARRLVAAWNACAGIPTKALLAGQFSIIPTDETDAE